MVQTSVRILTEGLQTLTPTLSSISQLRLNNRISQ